LSAIGWQQLTCLRQCWRKIGVVPVGQLRLPVLLSSGDQVERGQKEETVFSLCCSKHQDLARTLQGRQCQSHTSVT
jgi:hypothetical protein